MIYELFTLIGMAFFIKVFFKSAQKVVGQSQASVLSNKSLGIHALLGVLFIAIGRLLVLFL